jgi:hypothetical protein
VTVEHVNIWQTEVMMCKILPVLLASEYYEEYGDSERPSAAKFAEMWNCLLHFKGLTEKVQAGTNMYGSHGCKH